MNGLPSNPFSTRYTAPGQLDWIGPGDFFDKFCERWQASNYRAAIVGVHGSGKSTLLEHFVPRVAEVVWRRDAVGCITVGCAGMRCATDEMGEAEEMGDAERAIQARENQSGDRASSVNCRAYWLQLRRSEPQSLVVPWNRLNSESLLVLDGYEQLSLWRRALVLWRTKQLRSGLLVTSHRRTRLATLCELSVSVATARAVIQRLTAEFDAELQIQDKELRQRLADRDGNLRDLLMDLYDEVEARRLGSE